MNSITNRIKLASTVCAVFAAIGGAAISQVTTQKQDGHVSPLQVTWPLTLFCGRTTCPSNVTVCPGSN